MTKADGTLREALAGQALILFALSLTCLCGMAALAVDASGAWRAHSRLVSCTELIKDAHLNSLNLVKYSEDPAAETLTIVTDELKNDGFEGTWTVIYYELPESETGSADRFAGVWVELHQEYRTILAGVLGFETIDVADGLAWSINPYSSSVVWRPSDVRCRVYEGTTTNERGSSVTSTQEILESSYDTLPEDLREAIEAARDQADHFYETDGTNTEGAGE